MNRSVVQSALRLSTAERILLAERLWDSVAEEGEAPGLTQAQQEELDRRLKRLAQTGPLGSEWSVVKRRLLRKKAS